MLSHSAPDHGVWQTGPLRWGATYGSSIGFAEVSAPRRYLGKNFSALAYRISGKRHDLQSLIRFSPTTYTAFALSKPVRNDPC
jgi:hypothetical protein